MATKDFITYTPTSGSGNGTINVVASTNENSQSRSTSLNISGSGITKTINISQKEKPILNPQELGVTRWWQFNNNLEDTINEGSNTNAVPWHSPADFATGLNNRKCFDAEYTREEGYPYLTQTYIRSNTSDSEIKTALKKNSTCIISCAFVLNRRNGIINTKAGGCIEFITNNPFNSNNPTSRYIILFVNNNGKLKLQFYSNSSLNIEINTNISFNTTDWHYAICKFIKDENSDWTYVNVCIDGNNYNLDKAVILTPTGYSSFDSIGLGDYVGTKGSPQSSCFQYVQDFTLSTDVSDTLFNGLIAYYESII